MTMNFKEDHALQPFWQLAAAPIQTQALELALAKGLLNALEHHATIDEVAERFALHPRNTAVWLELLWSMGLLSRIRPMGAYATMYVASPLARRFFSPASAEDCSQAWLYRAGFLRGFAGQMGDFIAQAEAAAPAEPANPAAWARAAQAQIAQEQRAVTVPAALQLLRNLPALPACCRFLDLGGGPGLVAIALAKTYAAWQGTVCDLPEAAQIAQANIDEAGLSSRIATLGANLDRDPIGSGYDLIWCSSVLHFVQDIDAVLRKMFQALKPGGRLLLAHAEQREDAEICARVLPFYTPMRMRGRYLPEQGELASAMIDAGFEPVDALEPACFPMAPAWVYIGRRP